MDEKELKQRTKNFAHRCVKLALALPRTQLGNHISGQLQAISKKQITFKDKARADEKAQHTREYVSILKRLATP